MYCLVWPGLWQWLQSPVAFWLLLDAASSTTTDVGARQVSSAACSEEQDGLIFSLAFTFACACSLLTRGKYVWLARILVHRDIHFSLILQLSASLNDPRSPVTALLHCTS